MVATTASRPRRAARAAAPAPIAEADDQGHKDIAELTGAVRELAEALMPLKALADHVPALVEMAQVWNAGKTGGRAAWRMGEMTGAAAKWIAAVGGAFAVAYLAIHAKWDLLLKAVAP